MDNNIMSLDAFRSTRKLMSAKLYCEKYGLDTDEIASPFVFCYNGFYIEFDPSQLTMFYLIIGNWDTESNDIESLEKELYKYALGEMSYNLQCKIELKYINCIK